MLPRQQAIIWTNDDLVYWCINASPGLSELIEFKVDLHLIFSLASTWHVFMLFTLNSSPPGQDGRGFADDVFRCTFVNEKICILIEISLKFVPRGLIDNKAVLVQAMAWRQRATSHYLNRCWSSSLTHIYGTGGRWVNSLVPEQNGWNASAIIIKCICCEQKFAFCYKFCWSFVVNIPINVSIGTKSLKPNKQQVIHYLNQWWLSF